MSVEYNHFSLLYVVGRGGDDALISRVTGLKGLMR